MSTELHNSTADDDYNAVHRFISDFFTSYYTARNCAEVIHSFAREIVFVGLKAGQVTQGSEACRVLIQRQMDEVTKPIPYFVNNYKQTRTAEGMWNCYAVLDLNVISPAWGTVKYNICMTMVIGKAEGELKITMLHVSESRLSNHAEQPEPMCSPEAKSVAERELGRIISQMVPGGIVSRYASPGSPISIINEECLRILHHATYYECMEACGGFFEQLIHPDDLGRFQDTVHFVLGNDKQCEIDYRLKCSDGQYIWVHDTCRKATATDGKDLVVSILADVSTQRANQQRLERENETDELTSVYNRRGALRRLESWPTAYKTFALLLIDIDNFKQVNDIYGHKQGDKVLKYLAGLIDVQFGAQGIVCRMGGDEFSAFIPDYASIEELEQVTQTIIDIFKNRLDLVCPKANASISVGGICGDAPMDYTRVYSAADSNMYAVKDTTKNGLNITRLSREG